MLALLLLVLIEFGLTTGCAYLIHKYVRRDWKKEDGWWTLVWAIVLLSLLFSHD